MATNPTTCRGCGAEIVWVRLNGRWHPCDPKKLTIIADDKLISGHESHFATCPKAEDFRTKSQGKTS